MAQPTPYTPANDFSQDEVNSVAGRSTVKTAAVDSELAAISTTIGQILANLKVLQRDDTKLANAIVHANAFDAGALALMASKSWAVRGVWVTATAYEIGDVVETGGDSYVCAVAHTSGTFSTDQGAGYWVRLTGVSSADLSSSAAGNGASLVGIEDAASNFAATDVEAALAELFSNVTSRLLASAVSSFGATLIDDANASTALSTLGVSTYIKTLLDDADAATARGTLDLSGAYGIGSQFVVTPNTGALTVTVTGGYVHPKGSTKVQSVTGNTLGTVAPVTAGNSKIDMVCVDISTTSLVIVQGTEATTPVRPSLLPTQIPVAEFTLNYGDTEISSVVDVRNFIETNDFRGCLLWTSTSVNIVGGLTVAWDNEHYDTTTYGPAVQNFHSTTVNNSRITIPYGVTRVRLRASVNVFPPGSTAHTMTMQILKNGVSTYPGAAAHRRDFGVGEDIYIAIETPVLEVVQGDYFEVFLNTTTSTTTTLLGSNNGQTWFALEVIE